MGAPSNVIERINRLECARKRVEESKRADSRKAESRLNADVDRKARRNLLMEMAIGIFAWRDEVAKSRDGKRLWDLIGSGARVFVHSDWFWDGLPISDKNAVKAHTRVFLDGTSHHFLFEEWRNDDRGVPYPYQERTRISSPLDLVDRVHPLMIEMLYTHLTGPEAWQGVVDELDKWLDRYVILEPVRKGA